VAYRDGSPYLTYATTLGGYVDHAAKEMDQIDLSYKHGWPHPSDVRGELATQEQRDAVKHRALHALLEKL
jgi:hypothetical protein